MGILIYKYDDTYISTVRSAIEKYAKEANVAITLDMQDAQGDQAKQNDQLDVLIEKGVDVLAINAVDTGSAQGLADKAKVKAFQLISLTGSQMLLLFNLVKGFLLEQQPQKQV